MILLEARCFCETRLTSRDNNTIFCENCKREHGEFKHEMLLDRIYEKADEAGLRNLINDFKSERLNYLNNSQYQIVELYTSAIARTEERIKCIINEGKHYNKK